MNHQRYITLLLALTLSIMASTVSFAQLSNQPGFNPGLISSSFGGMSGLSANSPVIGSGPISSSMNSTWGGTIMSGSSMSSFSSGASFGSMSISSPLTSFSSPLTSTNQIVSFGGTRMTTAGTTSSSSPAIDFSSHTTPSTITPSAGQLSSPIVQPQLHVTR